MILNITNNFKKCCTKSELVFNFDFKEKNFNKIVFLPESVIVHIEKYIDVKQSNFKGEIIDSYCINLPIKYKKIYDKLNRFNSSILYESLIYKNTSINNIFEEVKKDNIKIIILERKNQLSRLDFIDKKMKKQYNVNNL